MSKRTVKKRTPAPAGRWKVFLMLPICGLIILSGFFFAARQHFSSMDFGIRNSRLRRKIDDLEAEKRRLLLAKEVSLSPAEIKKTAKKLGLIDSTPDGITAQVASASASAPKVQPQTAAMTTRSAKPMVIKTASVTAAATVAPSKIQTKATVAASRGSDRPRITTRTDSAE